MLHLPHHLHLDHPILRLPPAGPRLHSQSPVENASDTSQTSSASGPGSAQPSSGSNKSNDGSGNSLSLQAQIAIGVVNPVHLHHNRHHLWQQSMAPPEVSQCQALALLPRRIVPTYDRGIPTHHFIYLGSSTNGAQLRHPRMPKASTVPGRASD